MGSEPLLGNSHSHARGDALTKGASGCLDTRRPVVLGMPSGLAVELPEAFDVFKCYCWLPHFFVIAVDCLRLREVQHGPEQHRGVTVRKHEPIAIRPDRI